MLILLGQHATSRSRAFDGYKRTSRRRSPQRHYMPINVRQDNVRHNLITISLYDMIFINLNKAFISLNNQLIPKA